MSARTVASLAALSIMIGSALAAEPPSGPAAVTPAASAAPAAPAEPESSRTSTLDRVRRQAGRPVDPLFKQENTAENLRSTFRRIRDHIRAGQKERAARVGATLMPDPERVRKGLRANADPQKVEKLIDLHRTMMPARFDDIANIFSPDPTANEVRVFSATTEELLRPAKGTAAREVFPTGARKVAQNLLAPGVTWNMVELAKPDQHEGFRYHMIFWDGEHWTMLGPIWNEPR